MFAHEGRIAWPGAVRWARCRPKCRGDHPVAQGGQTPAPTGNSRRSIRLPAYDYSTPGAYFITLCIDGRRSILKDQGIKDLVEQAWNWLPRRFPQVELDEFVIMSDHVHFVVRLLDDADRRGSRRAAQGAQPRAPTLGNIVGAFKTVAARSINARGGTTGQRVWQRNYYERVIRNEDELRYIREYIRNNPLEAHNHESGDLSEAWITDARP